MREECDILRAKLQEIWAEFEAKNEANLKSQAKLTKTLKQQESKAKKKSEVAERLEKRQDQIGSLRPADLLRVDVEGVLTGLVANAKTK
jgi:predicted nuclease with TOPRIM domain